MVDVFWGNIDYISPLGTDIINVALIPSHKVINSKCRTCMKINFSVSLEIDENENSNSNI